MFKIELHKELTQVTTRQDTSLGIMRWGIDNSFPQTLVNLIAQSPTARPAVSRTAKFLKGSGFVGEDEIVSPYGLTLRKVVGIMADDYAYFEAFALQTNFNLKGEVVGINPMRIPTLRFNQFDELNFASKVGYHANFGRNSEVQKTYTDIVTKGKIKWFNRFNPEVVEKQIKNTKGGIDNYLGQILYFTNNGHSSYPIPPLQAAINYVLSDVENSILVRKESSTGFINSYLLKTTLSSEDSNLIALEKAIEDAQGARGNGKIITMTDLTPEDLSSTLLEEIGGGAGARSTIIDSATKAYDLTSRVINGAYQIPPILAGSDQKTGFSAPDLDDAYFVFNSLTQSGRDDIEQELNSILRHSIFKTKKIEINKLRLDSKEESEVNGTDDITVIDFLSSYISKIEKAKQEVPSVKDLIMMVNVFQAAVNKQKS